MKRLKKPSRAQKQALDRSGFDWKGWGVVGENGDVTSFSKWNNADKTVIQLQVGKNFKSR